MSLGIQIKRILSGLLYYSGVIAMLRQIMRGQNFILAYHRVLLEDAEELQFIEPGMYVTTKTFKMHLSYLSQHFKIVNLEELLGMPGIRNACAITFDDGWYDNYTNAFPILKEKKIPATIFLATNKIGSNEWPWTDKICYYVYKASQERLQGLWNLINHELNKYGRGLPLSIALTHSKSDLTGIIIGLLKILEDRALYTIMTLIDDYMVEYKGMLSQKRSWLSWQEVEDMAMHNIKFGAHTHDHVIMTNTDYARNVKEVRISKNIIKERLGTSPRAFCYPNGNFDNEIIDIIKRQEFKIAVTTQPGAVDETDNPLTLKRNLIHNDVTSTMPMFAYKIFKIAFPFN